MKNAEAMRFTREETKKMHESIAKRKAERLAQAMAEFETKAFLDLAQRTLREKHRAEIAGLAAKLSADAELVQKLETMFQQRQEAALEIGKLEF